MDTKQTKAYIAGFFQGQAKSCPDDLSILEAADTIAITVRLGSGPKARQLTIDGVDTKLDQSRLSEWLKREFQ